jgi:peptidoglycan/LPS O-acetylase OafA/YrhL
LSTITSTAERPKAAFRLDIQALRGFAVLAVVLYHAEISWLPAGYLGVDVFFVISGYLITSHIARELVEGHFSFAGFYYKRARRLLPAAYIVILANVLIAPYFISDVALEEMKAQVWGAVTFTTNFVLMGQSGYFDGAAETKPFLHFWSLAIEEQYYVVMPLALVLLSRKLWLAIVCAVLVVSLTACVWLASSEPSTAFYLSPLRAWELCIGSFVALAPLERLPASMKRIARIFAILILLVVPFFPTGLPHPSLDALLITMATGMVIAGASGSQAERSLPVRTLAVVGDISYSLYLVHWPVLVFTRAAWLEAAPQWALYVAVVISFTLSILLYLLVERPIQRGLFVRRKALVATLLAVSGVIAASPAALSAMSHDDQNFTEIRRTNYGLSIECTVSERRPFTGELDPECRTTPDAHILIWGDSYAMAWASVLMGPLRDEGLEQITRGACDPLLGMSRFSKSNDGSATRATAEECINTHKAILDYAISRQQVDTVFIAGRFSTILSRNNLMLVERPGGYADEPVSPELAASGLAGLAIKLKEAGKRVAFLAPPPANGTEIGDCLERQAKGKVVFSSRGGCDLAIEDVKKTQGDTWGMLKLAAQEADVPIIWANDFLCSETTCRTLIEGKFIYRDYGHMSVEGAQLIGEQSDVAKRALAAAR